MTAIEYLRKKSQLTNSCNGSCSIPCQNCKLSVENNEKNVGCRELEAKFPECAIAKVEKWWNEKEEERRNKINFTPELMTALKGRMAEGFNWIHVVTPTFIRLYKAGPISVYPLIFKAAASQSIDTEYFPIYENMAEKLFNQNRRILEIKDLIKEGKR